jgi:hypothetical protein
VLFDDEPVADRPANIGVLDVDPITLEPLNHGEKAVNAVFGIVVLFHLGIGGEHLPHIVELLGREVSEQLRGTRIEIHTATVFAGDIPDVACDDDRPADPGLTAAVEAKIAVFDLLGESAMLCDHVRVGKVVFGLDHKMHDIVLTDRQTARMRSLPNPEEGPVGAALLALEAKAMFTAFGKSYQRFYDELNSSHRAIHGSSNNALAVGLAIVNVADRFVSPIKNPDYPTTGEAEISRHNQPKDALGAIDKVGQLPRRTSDSGVGFWHSCPDHATLPKNNREWWATSSPPTSPAIVTPIDS